MCARASLTSVRSRESRSAARISTLRLPSLAHRPLPSGLMGIAARWGRGLSFPGQWVGGAPFWARLCRRAFQSLSPPTPLSGKGVLVLTSGGEICARTGRDRAGERREPESRPKPRADEPNSIPFLKRFTVFKVVQCEGLPVALLTPAAPLPERQIHEEVERPIEATGAEFRVGGARAFYVPAADYIQVPPQPAFFDQINYYRTCFHELGHWTGHGTRLVRDLSGGFGTKLYAREELVAEMARAFLCAALGIVPTVRHADYLGCWLQILREDSRAIFRAASQASKADLVRGFARGGGEGAG